MAIDEDLGDALHKRSCTRLRSHLKNLTILDLSSVVFDQQLTCAAWKLALAALDHIERSLGCGLVAWPICGRQQQRDAVLANKPVAATMGRRSRLTQCMFTRHNTASVGISYAAGPLHNNS